MAVRLEIDPRAPLGYRMVSDDTPTTVQQADDDSVSVDRRLSAEQYDLTPTSELDGTVRGGVLPTGVVQLETFEGGAWHPLPPITDDSINPWSELSWYREGALVLHRTGGSGTWGLWRAAAYVPGPSVEPGTDPIWEAVT